MSTELQRNFVTVRGRFGPRQVHFRRGGQGPTVLLLHQSPQSSREMEPLIAAWGSTFTVIAPDSPGYGCSDPLQKNGQPAGEASIDDFATAVLEFTDAIGVGRFGVYGFHTGASIGTALALSFPARVAAVAANGLAVLTEAEIAMFLRDYLPPLVPRWDGGHLAWLWARMREQTIFFPWHDRRAATRMDFDVPSADGLHQGLQEFLAAADHYAVAYRAAFTWHAEQHLPGINVPLLVTASARDPLAGHLGRVGARGAGVRIEPAGEPGDALDRCFRHLGTHPGDPGPAALAPEMALTEQPSCYRGAAGQQVRMRRHGALPGAASRTVLLVHAPGSSAAALDPLAQQIEAALGPETCVLTVDLPGHGASDAPRLRADGSGALTATVDQLVLALTTALKSAAGRGNVAIVGVGQSAVLALELAARLGGNARVAFLGAPDWSAADLVTGLREGLPPLTPVWSGGHLLEAWHIVRDGRLFDPWFRRERAAARRGEPDLDERSIQREVTDLLRASGSWQPLLRDLLAHLLTATRPSGQPVVRLATPPADWSGALFPATAAS